jgi:hypothetical protein
VVVSARVEKSHSSVLGMTVTRGATEEKSPAVRVQRSGRGYKGGAGEVLRGAISDSGPAYVLVG